MKPVPSWSQLQQRKRLNRRREQASHAVDQPVTGILHLRPNGDHWLRLEINGVSVLIHRAQMARLEQVFADARSEMDADSHRGQDRLHMQIVRLGAH
jgi:hypothetical protein